MTRGDLELLLRHAGALAHESDFFLFGSQSIRAVCTRMPREFPKTFEADLYPRHHPQAWALLRTKMGRGSNFYKRHGFFLDCVDPGLAMLPDGWLERLIPFRSPRTAGVTAWCLEPHDLFVSKLVAWREKDRRFLVGMLRHKLAKPMVVLNRIEDLPISASRKTELATTLNQLVTDMRTSRPSRLQRK
jgi:uncharacterized nucleotidyltransferase DUF6036